MKFKRGNCFWRRYCSVLSVATSNIADALSRVCAFLFGRYKRAFFCVPSCARQSVTPVSQPVPLQGCRAHPAGFSRQLAKQDAGRGGSGIAAGGRAGTVVLEFFFLDPHR